MTGPAQNELEQPKQPYAVVPIADTAKRSWRVTVDGKDITDNVHQLTLSHDKLGELEFGQRPEGYDGFVIRELEGVGSVIIPYMIASDGGFFIGVVEESRPTLGGNTLNVPRGMKTEKETHTEAAARELEEETGYKAATGRFALLATGLNSNSTYFDTSHSAEDGLSMYALRIEENELELSHDKQGNVSYVFPKRIDDRSQHDLTEKILGTRFIPLKAALKSRDLFTSAATGQLSGYLLDQGDYLTPQNHLKQITDTD